VICSRHEARRNGRPESSRSERAPASDELEEGPASGAVRDDDACPEQLSRPESEASADLRGRRPERSDHRERSAQSERLRKTSVRGTRRVDGDQPHPATHRPVVPVGWTTTSEARPPPRLVEAAPGREADARPGRGSRGPCGPAVSTRQDRDPPGTRSRRSPPPGTHRRPDTSPEATSRFECRCHSKQRRNREKPCTSRA
jgi:hypothetical protein